MSRSVKDWQPEAVEATPVAPHRYLWTGTPDEADYGDLLRDGKGQARARWAETIPYKKGEVVYMQHGDSFTRARILEVFPEFREYGGEWKPKFRVQRETKAGVWSKHWEYTYPGFIQRGYVRAGLAPDCEGKV